MTLHQDQQGAALITAVLLCLIFSIMATVSLNLGAQEVQQATTSVQEAQATHAAEAALGLLVQAFHDPRSPLRQEHTDQFVKRFEDPASGRSFFDAAGHAQFAGTPDVPDVWYDASRPADNALLNDSRAGWFRSFSSLGRILTLKAYGPMRPGLLCTLDATAEAGGITRSVSLQLGAVNIPALRTGIQAAGVSRLGGLDSSFPVTVHWGNLTVERDVKFARWEEIPTKTSLAPVTGESYRDTSLREDRWFELWIGGDIAVGPNADPPRAMPPNVFPHQMPSPGLKADRWDYGSMKKLALLYGTYYARDAEGLLYRNGRIEPGSGLTLSEVMKSESVGQHHGLVFIDTLDQAPPREDNLGTLIMDTDYAEGLFIINAHVQWRSTQAGKSVPVLSPPSEGTTQLGSRIPVELSSISLNGVLSVAGDLFVSASPRVYGSITVGGDITAQHGANVEVWYEYELAGGLFRGLPVVYPVPGTWQIHG